jgi:hypothetical protein
MPPLTPDEIRREIERLTLETYRRIMRLYLRLGYLTVADLQSDTWEGAAHRVSPEAARSSSFGQVSVDTLIHIVWLALRSGKLAIGDLADRDAADAAEVAGDLAAVRGGTGRR